MATTVSEELAAKTRQEVLTPIEQRIDEVRDRMRFGARAQAVFDHAAPQLDLAKVAQLQAYVRENFDLIGDNMGFKYLDLPHYLADKARWIVELDLDRRPPERILDLGVGGGHFPFLAKTFGHDVVGLDLDVALYTRILAVYGVPRVVCAITPGKDLPVEGKFDIVTALQLTFNRLNRVQAKGRKSPYWTPEEWAMFFERLGPHMNYPSRIFFGLNKQPNDDGSGEHAPELMALFARNGALVDERKYSVLFTLEKPLSLAV